jgi:CheY-like chemotaxis protein
MFTNPTHPSTHLHTPLRTVLNGVDTTRLLRQRGYKHLIFGLTGNSIDIDVEEFETAGLDLLLTKPLSCSKLQNVLENLTQTENGLEFKGK